MTRIPASVDDLVRRLHEAGYVADRELAVTIFLSLVLRRPLLLEGESGVGKTEVARTLAAVLDAELIRLQCYEGLDVHHAVYEWNYARQMLEIRLREASGALGPEATATDLFRSDLLVKRPLLRALEGDEQRPRVLLIDEVDRADEEFEGYLLEFLADFQVSIPELGTIRAGTPPVVVLTSNRTREIHDALKRRCLYAWIDYPTFDKELAIVRSKVPAAPEHLARQVTGLAQALRQVDLEKTAGVSETLDWTAALLALGRHEIDEGLVHDTIGLLLKHHDDIEEVRRSRVGQLVAAAVARTSS